MYLQKYFFSPLHQLVKLKRTVVDIFFVYVLYQYRVFELKGRYFLRENHITHYRLINSYINLIEKAIIVHEKFSHELEGNNKNVYMIRLIK